MLQSDVGFLDCQKCAGTQPPKATSLDRKKPPWGTFPVFPLPCNTPPIVYVKKKLYLHDIFLYVYHFLHHRSASLRW